MRSRAKPLLSELLGLVLVFTWVSLLTCTIFWLGFPGARHIVTVWFCTSLVAAVVLKLVRFDWSLPT